MKCENPKCRHEIDPGQEVEREFGGKIRTYCDRPCGREHEAAILAAKVRRETRRRCIRLTGGQDDETV